VGSIQTIRRTVWLPEVLQNNQGLKNHVPPLSDRPGWGSVFAFGLALVDTMQSWRDQMQLALPGFRDRIVHVSHSKEEGGLNLSMPPDVIRTLADSGVEAAEKLLAAFAGEDGTRPGPGWANHQRIRARTLLCLVQQQLQKIARALATVERRPYADVIADTHPPSYPFADQADADNAQWLVRELDRIARELASRQAQLCAGAPRPSPDLRVSPRV
jgi:hypothetical protein